MYQYIVITKTAFPVCGNVVTHTRTSSSALICFRMLAYSVLLPCLLLIVCRYTTQLETPAAINLFTFLVPPIFPLPGQSYNDEDKGHTP
jgi:hypothetical protein